ncbi:MAG: integrin alpha [Actinobacteria bacterium]|nr:integrin alpha [Actinomycetota bacterium]
MLLASLGPALLPGSMAAQAGTVRSEQKISETAGGFGGLLVGDDHFGGSIVSLGDLDGDGVSDLAVGADGDNDGGQDQGAVWILFLNADGTVENEQKISELTGGFGGVLDPGDHFGCGVAAVGDLDGDGVPDLCAGAEWDDDGGNLQGALWMLFLNADGTVKAQRKISETAGGFGGTLNVNDNLGRSVAALGDLDGDGVTDLAVGAPGDHLGASVLGAVWILFLNPDGTVKAEQKINELNGGFGGNLDHGDLFGISVAALGDLDGDGVGDLAVGAPRGDDEGAVWILFMNSDGTVSSEQKVSDAAGGFGGVLGSNDQFGISVAAPGDLDGDGTVDLAVGANHDSFDGYDQGATWILFMAADGTVESEQKISETSGGFGGDLDPGVPFSEVGDQFGWSLAALGDQDGDGVSDLAVGALWDDDGGNFQGAVWILFMAGPPECVTLDFETEDDLVTPLVNGQHVDTEFGNVATLTSSGPNAGLAIFDSSVGGPNDPSQDRDLLVGSGNLLVLQTENLPPDANDVFPRPNDDEDGGTISFEFAVPLEARSVHLVDVDAGDGAGSVVLTDSATRTRSYAIPANWTGDLLLGQPGQGTLDLSTLAPQPGFGALATAVEVAGFDPLAVVRMDVHVNGSGGLDELALCFARPARARVAVRNGSGVNPVSLSSDSMPVLGRTWAASLDCPGTADALAVLEVRSSAASGDMTPVGEALIAGTLVHRAHGVAVLARAQLGWDVPFDLSLLGREFHAQGLCRRSIATQGKTSWTRSELTNALDLVLGF